MKEHQGSFFEGGGAHACSVGGGNPKRSESTTTACQDVTEAFTVTPRQLGCREGEGGGVACNDAEGGPNASTHRTTAEMSRRLQTDAPNVGKMISNPVF